VSPVVACLIFILLFGRHGWQGGWLDARDVQVGVCGAVVLLATLLVPSPLWRAS
jgi:sulfate transport system permease protein